MRDQCLLLWENDIFPEFCPDLVDIDFFFPPLWKEEKNEFVFCAVVILPPAKSP